MLLKLSSCQGISSCNGYCFCQSPTKEVGDENPKKDHAAVTQFIVHCWDVLSLLCHLCVPHQHVLTSYEDVIESCVSMVHGSEPSISLWTNVACGYTSTRFMIFQIPYLNNKQVRPIRSKIGSILSIRYLQDGLDNSMRRHNAQSSNPPLHTLLPRAMDK